MDTRIKTLFTVLFLIAFLIGGMNLGNSMNSISSFNDPHNGWYCNGDDNKGECASNYNVTCCNNIIGAGCEDVGCGTDPGEN
jgi:hypothetical protein